MNDKIRLNSLSRQAIRSKLLEQRFAKREKEIAVEESQLAMDIYLATFNPKERRLMNSLPEGWLPEASTICARLGHNDFYGELPGKKKVRVPSKHKKNSWGDQTDAIVALEASHELSIRAKKLREEKDSIKEQKRKLETEISATLGSVQNANKLIQVWPEIKSIVNAACKAYVLDPNLPAPRIDYLNRELGLKAAA